MPRVISRFEFDQAVEALWEELQYQDGLPRRTDDEAKDVPGFLTLGRRYQRAAENAWADNPGEYVSEAAMSNPSGIAVPAALHGLRKLAAIYVRGMIYCGIVRRM